MADQKFKTKSKLQNAGAVVRRACMSTSASVHTRALESREEEERKPMHPAEGHPYQTQARTAKYVHAQGAIAISKR